MSWPKPMCGRYTLRTPAKELARFFNLDEVPEFQPRYNIAPSQEVAAVRAGGEQAKRELVLLQWGLIPSWSKEPQSSYSTINARAETVAEKPSFRAAFRKRRCLIAADGYYEWKPAGGKKQPYFLHAHGDGPFAFAGLWERWQGGGREIESCTIIVTEANEAVRPIHDRMPVILAPDCFDAWLDPELHDAAALQELLRAQAPALEARAVSTLVNNPRNDRGECIEAIRTVEES